jgi:hypothetical protein
MVYSEISENDMKNLVECVEDMTIYDFKLKRYNMEYCYAPISKMKTVNLDSFYFECKEFLLNLGYSVKVEAISYNMYRVNISKANNTIERVGIDEKDTLFIATNELIKKF